jgi:hypothetical protein
LRKVRILPAFGTGIRGGRLMETLSVAFDPKPRTYTGTELRPHFLLSELGLKGSGVGAFIGPCQVKTEHLVDWEDRLASDHIQARSMVHFIVELFGAGLREAVLAQRLFISILGESLREQGHAFRRAGDDLMLGERKLSVSIATASAVSQLIHIGINIDPTGAPVAAVGLEELGVESRAWAEQALRRFAEEWSDIDWARSKVRPV